MLTNNEIGVEGGKAIGHALKTNSTLLHLNLRMNRSLLNNKFMCQFVHFVTE